jgi:2-polyprenyl-3-methyl-5-hydroxy-6-metoxy-1,4-benzoquinol methylase/glycosyltransferase involved in cell wall biosynthesis
MDIANIVNGHAERFVSTIKEFNFKTVYEHLHRYAYALQFVNDKRVLDLGCGEGYGSWILAQAAKDVVGIDRDNHIVEHAQTTYKKDNLKFVLGNVEELPFCSSDFDIVVCFEVIEHIIAQEECMVEVRRVLRDDGILLISSPVKPDTRKEDSLNPFHLKELTAGEFEELLCKNFEHVRVMGQKVVLVSDIRDFSGVDRTSHCIQLFYERNDNDYVRILNESKNRRPDYLLAIASDKDINSPTKSVLMNVADNEVEQFTELERALECASHIFKRKHEASSRHLLRLKASESKIADLEKKLAKKDAFVQKTLRNFTRIISMNIRTRPSMITEKISVIIPVKNGAEELKVFFNRIRSQRKVQNVEIIVIDSESTDKSVDIAMENGAKVIKISQKEFNHGATRNLGAKEAQGDFLIFTVQDALPLNNYWLYNMICPFIAYPELAALSAKQFVKPEADLFSLWMAENMTELLGFKNDSIYSLSAGFDGIDWKFFDSMTKRRLTFFDNVSSCIRSSVLREMQFSPLVNAEDIDFGVKLLKSRKSIGYMTSTGVYHWHERGPDYVFNRFYMGTKAGVHILENDLLYFFDSNKIGWECLIENIAGIHELISLSIAEMGNVDSEPIRAIKSFINALQRNVSKGKVEKTLRERNVHIDDGLGRVLREVIGDRVFTVEQKYNFTESFLLHDFMERFQDVTDYLYRKHHTLDGREKEFVSCVYKIFAITAGEALGAYYLEAESLNRLTPELERIDLILGKGVCYC